MTLIYANTLTEDTRNGPVSYYRSHISIGKAEFKGKNAEEVEIRPGMTAQVDIRLRDRTVLSYLTKPITKTINQGMGDR